MPIYHGHLTDLLQPGIAAYYEAWFLANAPLQASVPLIKPLTPAAIGIELSHVEYVHISNFFVTYVVDGIQMTHTSNSLVNNIFVFDNGYDQGNGGPGRGNGFECIGPSNNRYLASNNIFDSCIVYNSRECGFRFEYCSTNTAGNCEVYNDVQVVSDKFAGTDYYFNVFASSDCTLSHCKAHRATGSSHEGHAFSVSQWSSSTAAFGNKILDCSSYNCSDALLLRGKTTGNEVTNFESNVDDPASKVRGCIHLTGGPVSNEFTGVHIYDAKRAFWVQASTSYGAQAIDPVANLNKFVSCSFEADRAFYIQCHNDSTGDLYQQDFRDNTFTGCPFVGKGTNRVLFEISNAVGTGVTLPPIALPSLMANTMDGCSVTNFKQYLLFAKP